MNQDLPKANLFGSDIYVTSYAKIFPASKPVSDNGPVLMEYEDHNSENLKTVLLSTKKAVTFLLEGTLKNKVCRYCLHITSSLSELDQVLQIASSGVLFKVTIRDLLASFHPIKVVDDPSFPNQICEKCLDKTIASYLFTQQCEQSERALRNCFDDVYEKLNKLDSIDKTKKKGRHKIKPNYNTLYVEHRNVINYAEPLINIRNLDSELNEIGDISNINKFECHKCWQVLPNMQSLINHERSHPKSMWYNCKLCGKSFVKYVHYKKHIQLKHGQVNKKASQNIFRCSRCADSFDNVSEYLQHLEKHKFHNVMQCLIERKMNKLCSVCLEKSSNMKDLEQMVCLHGGYPDLMGDKTLYHILASTLPDMNSLHNYIGTKICEKCLSHAITSYIFIHRFNFIRERLNICIDLITSNLKQFTHPESSLLVEISKNIICPLNDIDETLLLTEDEVDESKLKIEVLEDEFREPDSGSEYSSDENIEKHKVNLTNNVGKSCNKKLVNGYQKPVRKLNSTDICSEFLTFNKRKPIRKKSRTCPLCYKRFISKYFLKKHVLKHVFNKVSCKICCTEFKSKFFLYEHVRMVHLLKQFIYFACKTCGRSFTNQDKLTTHVRNHKLRKCRLCQKRFGSQKSFENHIQRHLLKLNSRVNEFQTCSFCEEEFYSDHEFSIHLNKIHLQIKPYSCDMCDRQFYTERSMRRHQKIHSVIRREVCELCNKSLKCRSKLVVHLRKHAGDKPFKCPVCSQSFYTKLKVNKHLKAIHNVNSKLLKLVP